MRRTILLTVTVAGLLIPATACGSDSSSPTPPGPAAGQMQQTPPASAPVPEVNLGEPATVTQEQYGPVQGVTGTATVTLSDYAPLTPAEREDYFLTVKGTPYKAWVEITNLTGEFMYNSLYFSLHTPEGDIIDAESVSIDPDLGSGTLRTGEKRRGNIVFDVPANANVTEIVLVATDMSTRSAAWKLP